MGTTQEIRRALETRVGTVTGFPSAGNRAWENVRFEPTPGTSWARMVLVPDTQRPATRGPSPQIRYDGSFLIVLHFPEGTGAGAIDDLADDVRDAFTVDDVVTAEGTNVRFEWSERNDGVLDPPWYVVTVTVRWYTYASS
jgi:hypothetical protein